MRKTSATCLIWIAILSMVAGCSMTPQQSQYTAAGAAGGALVGGGIGCAIAASIDYDDPTSYSIGCPIGVGAGALIGGVIGYVLAPGPIPLPPPVPASLPPPPPPPPPAAVQEKTVFFAACTSTSTRRLFAMRMNRVLDEAAAKLKANCSSRIDVNGYTDVYRFRGVNLKLFATPRRRGCRLS